MPTDAKIPVPEEVAAMPLPGERALRRGAWKIAADLPASFRYAAQGLTYAFVSQRNFRIHVITGLVVFGLGFWLQLDWIQLAVLVLTVAAVLVLELLNTAIEAVVDLAIGRRFHPLARIAKASNKSAAAAPASPTRCMPVAGGAGDARAERDGASDGRA